MKKHLFLAATLAALFVSAQKNDALYKEFKKQRNTNNEKFDALVARNREAKNNKSDQKEIEEKRSLLAGFIGDSPYFYQLHDIDQIKNSNSDFIQNGTVSGLTGSFNGENIKFTVFDGGRVYAGHEVFNNSTNRITNKEASTMNYSAHATGVSSFIGGKAYTYLGKNIQGIAKNSTIDSYSFSASKLPGSTTESTVFQKILTAMPKISNHSYGTNLGWDYKVIDGSYKWLWTSYYNKGISYDAQGLYFTTDQNYDQIVYNNPSYIIVKSAGNSFGMLPPASAVKYYSSGSTYVKFKSADVLPKKNCDQGYDCIGPGSLAKNIIIVGASDIITANGKRYNTASDVVHSSYSSAGPRDDGGIKPDITTVGSNVSHASTAENTIGSQDYASGGNGTSYSGPIVTGIIGLWTQINKQLFSNAELNAASAKVLTIHSASEAGNIGPDPQNGWGFINAKKGAELLVGKSNNTVIFTDETLNSSIANKKTVTASGTEPLKVTISWIDPEYKVNENADWPDLHNNRTSKLVNDLDLRIIDTSNNTVYYPWKLDVNSPMTAATKADNKVDNVEQVVIDAPVAGRSYRIEITNKGSLVNNLGAAAPQKYSIIVTGHSGASVSKTNQTLAQESPISNIIIAPTKTKDIVKVLNAPKKATFNIYDLSGKKLQSGNINGDTESLNLSAYSNGIYIIEVKTEKDVISKRVIKE